LKQWRSNKSAGSALAVASLLVCRRCHGPRRYAAGEAVPQFRQVSNADVSASLRKVRRIRFAIRRSAPVCLPQRGRRADRLYPAAAWRGVQRAQDPVRVPDPPGRLPSPKALEANEVDAVVSFTTPDAAQLLRHIWLHAAIPALVQPLCHSRVGSPIERDLAAHAWLASASVCVPIRARPSFSRATIRVLPWLNSPLQAELYDALRLARVDAIFEDSFRLMFWLQGNKLRKTAASSSAAATVSAPAFPRPSP
jgi:hypothetical protein